MNKIIMISLILGSVSLVGCDKFKPKPQESTTSESSAFSCTDQEHIQSLQNFLKQEYLKEIDRKLRQSSDYEADQSLLQTINNGLKFELKNIRTITQDKSQTSELECEAQINVKFPKGLQLRAENAYVERSQFCEECEFESLQDELDTGEFPLSLQNDVLKGNYQYNVIKTDKEGISLSAPSQSQVVDAVVRIAQLAVQYEAYMKQNANIQESSEQYEVQHNEQMALAQKAMEIRQKELTQDKEKVVERLNTTWDRFGDEQKAQLQQDQSDWFERRDVDCKVISQKRIDESDSAELETYQQHRQYWDESMRQNNQQMQYDKCFIQKTNERIVYLNNVFN